MDEFPELKLVRERLLNERDQILTRSKKFRDRKDAINEKLQPLMGELREVDREIKAIEQPRLAQIDNQLGKLAIAMGGRRLSQPE